MTVRVAARHVNGLVVAYIACSFVAITIWMGVVLAIGIDISKDAYYCDYQAPPSEWNFELSQPCRLNIGNMIRKEGIVYVVALVLANVPSAAVFLLQTRLTTGYSPIRALAATLTVTPYLPLPHPGRLTQWVAFPSAVLMGMGIGFWVWLAVYMGDIAVRWIFDF